MTQQQYERLRKYEETLLAAAAGRRPRYLTEKAKKDMTDVFNEITGKNTSSGGCSSCNFIGRVQRLGRWYKQYQQNINNE